MGSKTLLVSIDLEVRPRRALARWHSEEESKEVALVILGFFEAGKNKNPSSTSSLHPTPGSLTKIDENLPAPGEVRRTPSANMRPLRTWWAALVRLTTCASTSLARLQCALFTSPTTGCSSTTARSKRSPPARGSASQWFLQRTTRVGRWPTNTCAYFQNWRQ